MDKNKDEYVFIHPKSGETHSKIVTMEEVQAMVFDQDECVCSGPCECWVEPDGTCPNGWPSVLRSMGIT